MKKCSNKNCNAENPDDAIYCHMCGTKLTSMSDNIIDKTILNIVEQYAKSKEIFAAYKGKKNATHFCRKQFGITFNNKKYVERLMDNYYPKELEKASLGKNFLMFVFIAIILFPLCYGIITLLMVLLKVIPTYKKLKSLCI